MSDMSGHPEDIAGSGFLSITTPFSAPACPAPGRSLPLAPRSDSYANDMPIDTLSVTLDPETIGGDEALLIRVRNLVDDLHWRVACDLVLAFDVILLPSFARTNVAESHDADRDVGPADVEMHHGLPQTQEPHMIIYTDGDLFESPAKVLVNTVNTRGVMGKGIALRFKQIYPEMFKEYRDQCKLRHLTIGKLQLFKTTHKWILNFPTKEHWRNPSRPEYIEAGLVKFRETYARIGAASYAFPMLGCGNGELDFDEQVRPLMERYLGNLSVSTRIHIGRDHIDPPERLDAERITAWLRSEPLALPFDEVWRDLVRILERQQKFATWKRRTDFTVRIEQALPAIVVLVSGRTSTRIVEEELIDFWQQLRDHGLTHRGIAPDHRHLSYLLPVFERLDYVRSVAVSDTASRLETSPRAALQVVPPSICSGLFAADRVGSTRVAAQALRRCN
ncbi:MAG: macro domain-containing protein [Boseongicola sp.]|nr:macro domain-containing protein [Boseongicola sp.]